MARHHHPSAQGNPDDHNHNPAHNRDHNDGFETSRVDKTAESSASSENAASDRWKKQRPVTAPDFLLSRPHGSIRTQGVLEQISDPWLAAEQLHSGIHNMVVGAIPFDLDKPAALTVPRDVIRSAQPLEPPAHYRWNCPEMHARVVRQDPEPEEHVERVEAAIRTIEHSGLEKIVLARMVELEIDPPIDPLQLAARLIDGSPNRDGFVVDLSAAGEDWNHKLLIGSSPEMLVRRTGTRIEAFPLAGSLPRSRNRQQDHENAARLKDSLKNGQEHAFVVDDIANNLAPLCKNLEVPEEPELLSTSEMWHLGTHIHGELSDESLSALDLALIVHPTPAICGTPTESAFGVINAVESDRGFYSGAVGWCDASGDGEFVVSIRCAEISTNGDVAKLWAGGGIVEHSVPEEELAETQAKMGTVLRAFGLR